MKRSQLKVTACAKGWRHGKKKKPASSGIPSSPRLADVQGTWRTGAAGRAEGMGGQGPENHHF